MASPERIYHGLTRVLSLIFVAVGIALLVATLGAGGGPLSVGTVLGVAFVGIGAGRLWISSRMNR